MNKIGILFFLLLIALSACRDDINDVAITEETPESPLIEGYEPMVVNVNGSVVGFVVDELNAPVIDANVQLRNQTVHTDQYGHFFINDLTMNSLGALVQVQKEGYFDGSRRIFPIEGELNRVKIQLLEKSFDASFTASNGGTISVGDASVVFSPASIRTAGGNDYNGNVRVAAKWLDPASSAILDQMPGNLQGVNSEVEQVVLATYGMVMIELEGDSGESLHIAEGSTAQIMTPVPADLAGAAPAEIPLWSYNEEHGLWVEESTATLQNGSYVGEVSHFSIWGFGFPDTDLAFISMTLMDDSGNPLVNHLVTLSVSGGAITGFAYTDASGGILWFVPANEVMTMEVIFDGVCATVLYTDQIGPFDVYDLLSAPPPVDLGNITIPAGPGLNSITLTGNLLDCNGDPVSNGLAIVSFDGNITYHYTSTSNFSIMLSTCDGLANSVEVTAVDFDNLIQGAAMTFPIVNGMADIGNLAACDSALDAFFNFSINGTRYDMANNCEYIYFPNTNNEYFENITGGYSGFSTAAPPNIRLNFAHPDMRIITGVGAYDVTELNYNFYKDDPNPNNIGGITHWNSGDLNAGELTVDITSYGENPGDHIEGTLQGTLDKIYQYTNYAPAALIDSIENVAITGSFRVVTQ